MIGFNNVFSYTITTTDLINNSWAIDASVPALYYKDNEGTFHTISLSGGGGGAVTSVGLTMPGIFAVAGSPITTSGTLAVTLATQAANEVWAGPTSGRRRRRPSAL